jgi:hypothetical protein
MILGVTVAALLVTAAPARAGMIGLAGVAVVRRALAAA